MMIANKYLPEDIVKEILLRLDVKSLRRFECVCKSWKTLIRRPSFVNNHFKRQPSSVILFHFSPAFDHNLKEFKFDCEVSCYSDCFDKLIQRREILPSEFLRLEGCDNGVVCFGDFFNHDNICLWNPATNEFKTLPPPPPPPCHSEHPTCLLGFGFDSLTDDYKVVRVFSTDSYLFTSDSELSVYNLGRNSWKRMEMSRVLSSSLPEFSSHVWANPDHRCSVVVKESINWNMSFQIDNEKKKSILAFDLNSEVIKTINLPQLVEYKDLFLDKLSERLSLVVTHDRNAPIFDVWVMKEYGVSDSWIKQVKVDLVNYPGELPPQLHGIGNKSSQPLAFGCKGNVLILESDEKVILYDLESHKAEYLCPSMCIEIVCTTLESVLHL
ncbi:hypothetical protein TIFTF001_022868 [Ficus carica]|uniref:F-box domain-containing protein n=1 Tax=Ficus carica TaxID=3494 RepID=A0AA88AZQ7_FICCA|nr:hypothetical protein TIFTF001_022868 [Ficus carica]